VKGEMSKMKGWRVSPGDGMEQEQKPTRNQGKERGVNTPKIVFFSPYSSLASVRMSEPKL